MRQTSPVHAILALALLASPLMAPSARAAADPFTLETTAPLAPPVPRAARTPHYRVVPLGHALATAELGGGPVGATTVPLWSHTVFDGGAGFTSQMVGTNPFVKQINPVSVVPIYVIPVAVHFLDWGVTLDPTAIDHACSPDGTPLALALNSPVFKNVTPKLGAIGVGTGQIVDLFQRANFWKYTAPGALNPNYHVVLKPTLLLGNKVTWNVHGGPQPDNSGCGNAGFIPSEAWDPYVQNKLIPSLPAAVTARTLPLFLFYDTTFYDNGDPSQCCTLGWHGSYTRANRLQTYAISNFDSTGIFGTDSMDVATLTHEIAEWMDDPTGDNPTLSWGNLGQVSGCQNNLEVGDPLSGTVRAMTVPGQRHVFHVQDLAFYSWFYHQKPSIAVNGWYSLFGTFRKPAAACS